MWKSHSLTITFTYLFIITLKYLFVIIYQHEALSGSHNEQHEKQSKIKTQNAKHKTTTSPQNQMSQALSP